MLYLLPLLKLLWIRKVSVWGSLAYFLFVVGLRYVFPLVALVTGLHISIKVIFLTLYSTAPGTVVVSLCHTWLQSPIVFCTLCSLVLQAKLSVQDKMKDFNYQPVAEQHWLGLKRSQRSANCFHDWERRRIWVSSFLVQHLNHYITLLLFFTLWLCPFHSPLILI